MESDNNDCLTDAFITIYKNSIWCIESLYKLVFKSLWQVLLLTKEDYDQKTVDMMSINNSASKNYRSRHPR